MFSIPTVCNKEPPVILCQMDMADHDVQLKTALSRFQISLNLIETQRAKVLQEINSTKRLEPPQGCSVGDAACSFGT